MMIRFQLHWFFTLFILYSNTLFAVPSQEISIAPAEDWIVSKEFELPKVIPEDIIENGVHYLLTDEQISIEKNKPVRYYRHYAEVITNQKGLEYSSQIQVRFDPAYQSLIFHALRIVREGKVIDKLTTADIKVLQRERELEELIYNGDLSANIILDDVRIGDVIEYSFTIVGDNPIYNGLFSYRVFTQWRVPLEQQYFRLLWRKEEPVYVKSINTDIKISENKRNEYTEYVFEASDSKPLAINSEAPLWYYPYGQVIFSESASWSDVINWAVPLYKDALMERDGVAEVVKTIIATTTNKEEQIIAALRYVQEEIRYMGIETGENSHRPSPAFETLKRRYGDCKDKVVLYISILDELGVNAYPALVNTDITKMLGELPPYVDAFNHVIVLIESEGKTYWFDPARQYQYGSIEEIYQPNLGFALIVRPEITGLTKINSGGKSGLIVNEKFDLTQGAGNIAKYTSTSEYYGYRAERQRNQIAAYGLADLEKRFTDFYKVYYPGIERKGKLSINSKSAYDRLILNEDFEIHNFWETDEENNKYIAEFYANLISTEIKKPDQLHRNSPYRLKFPNNIRQNIEIKFDSGEWWFEDDNYVDNNQFFLFEYNAKFNKTERVLQLQYHLEVKSDSVAVGALEAYLEALDNAWGYTNYSIFDYINPSLAAPNDEEELDLKSMLFVSIFAGYCLAVLFAILSWRLETRKQAIDDNAIFYPVSLIKLYVLSVVTFGIYMIYWFYRNWKYVKENEASAIMPIARGIFSCLWYYPLYRKLVQNFEDGEPTHKPPSKVLAVLLAVFYFITTIVSNVDYIGVPFMILAPLLIVPLANYINHIRQNDMSVFLSNSRWKFRHYLLTVFFVPVIVPIYGGELNLLPSSKVVDGRFVWEHDLKFMQRKGIVSADEEIILFYSDANLDIRDDGSGFTKTQVFSYWVGDDDNLEIRRAALKDVKEIRTSFAKEWAENTTFTIVLGNGSEFVLYASTESGKDRVFDQVLRERWLLEKESSGNDESIYRLNQAEWLKQKRDVRPSIFNEWLVKASESGSIEAQYQLGISLLSSFNGKDGEEQGLKLICDAAEKGHPGAALFLGDLYSKGIHFPKDPAQAVRLYEQALLHKHRSAPERLAWHLSTLKDKGLRDGARAVEIILNDLGKKRTSKKLIVLAAAYAEIGDFEKSIEVQKEALSLGKKETAGDSDQRKFLDSYLSGKAWRETWTDEQYKMIEYLPY